ncbi:hypothetical protein [Halorarum salinum]|uniref:Uncharacterized protein n=1 Tax=Halorarum salinum TaxID=2743089 RepID=A0A7D5QG07_9EURY|nr:hypothetical protein [Halobaculum salinum]QLG61104.1 hypothetical protein HUG12_04885 [Halobaculum salinum]
MTQQFDRLQEEPQTEIDRGRLNPTERQQLRTIDVSGTAGLPNTNTSGKFTTVYYLAGEEEVAAEKFTEENRDQLEQIDFSKSNALQTSVDRPVYDWILHHAGERTLTKYETVVREERADGSQWIIGRNKFDDRVDRRYGKNERGTAYVPPELSLNEVFERCGETITEEDLRLLDIDGDVREVLDLFRHDPSFPCEPISTHGMLAVRKTAS